jgi:hypothetical protein
MGGLQCAETESVSNPLHLSITRLRVSNLCSLLLRIPAPERRSAA